MAFELHVYCHVSGEARWLAPPALRDYIFRREMALVLDTIRFGDRDLLASHPELKTAAVLVHFQSTSGNGGTGGEGAAPAFVDHGSRSTTSTPRSNGTDALNRVEEWGALDDPTSWTKSEKVGSRSFCNESVTQFYVASNSSSSSSSSGTGGGRAKEEVPTQNSATATATVIPRPTPTAVPSSAAAPATPTSPPPAPAPAPAPPTTTTTTGTSKSTSTSTSCSDVSDPRVAATVCADRTVVKNNIIM